MMHENGNECGFESPARRDVRAAGRWEERRGGEGEQGSIQEAGVQRFTWLWSSLQFCTRTEKACKKDRRGKVSLAKLEGRGRRTRNRLTGQRERDVISDQQEDKHHSFSSRRRGSSSDRRPLNDWFSSLSNHLPKHHHNSLKPGLVVIMSYSQDWSVWIRNWSHGREEESLYILMQHKPQPLTSGQRS